MALTARFSCTAQQRRPRAATHSLRFVSAHPTRVLPERAVGRRARGKFPPGQIVPPRVTPTVSRSDLHRDVTGARRGERVAGSPR
jgi:hypothetical protein